MRVALLRHGRTAWNEAGRLQGRSDVPLTPEERERLSRLALPPDWRGADVLSSPLRRARETADILADGAVRTEAALVEMDLGAWEGRRGVDLLDDPASGYRHVEAWGWDMRPPNGGETPRDVLGRAAPVLAGLARDTLIVSHINVMRAILADAHGWDFDGPMPFRIKRDRLHVLRREGGAWVSEGSPVRLVAR